MSTKPTTSTQELGHSDYKLVAYTWPKGPGDKDRPVRLVVFRKQRPIYDTGRRRNKSEAWKRYRKDAPELQEYARALGDLGPQDEL